MPRNDGRTRARDEFGKPGVSFPEGSLSHPTIVEERTAGQDTKFKAFLRRYVDDNPVGEFARFVYLKLTGQASSKGDNNDATFTERYRTLPGVIFTDTRTDASGIPLLVARQERAADDLFTCGTIEPTQINISSITKSGSDGTVLVTLASSHELPPGAFVVFAGTTTTPNINGTKQIVSVPAANQVRVTAPVTVASGAAGTMEAKNFITRERRATDNVNVFVKVDTMAACADVSAFDQTDVPCRKVYPFPDYLVEAIGYTSFSQSTSFTTGSSIATSISTSSSGGITLNIQNGYRGQCDALRTRRFFMGPPPQSFFDDNPPTIVIPSSGTVLIHSLANAWGEAFNGSSYSFNESTSHSYRAMNVPPVLTGPTPGVISPSISVKNVSSISTSVSSKSTITTSTAHGFAVGDVVLFAGTNSTPSVDGYVRVYAVGSTTTFDINREISGAGTAAGTVQKANNSDFHLDIPLSSPTHFMAGDIINVMDEPVRLDAGEIYVVDLWEITVPYDSGSPPP